MLGGAPGVGKSSVARYLLKLAEDGPGLLQWVDVDALWPHQPWRVDDRMTAMTRPSIYARTSRPDEPVPSGSGTMPRPCARR